MPSDYLDYENLAFDTDKATMPRCDIEELKKENSELLKKIDKLESDIKVSNNNAQHWFDVARGKSVENKYLEEIIKLLVKKIWKLNPDYEDWLLTHFKEYM